MKIIKTASGKELIKLSKVEWLKIGQAAGWTVEQPINNRLSKNVLTNSGNKPYTFNGETYYNVRLNNLPSGKVRAIGYISGQFGKLEQTLIHIFNNIEEAQKSFPNVKIASVKERTWDEIRKEYEEKYGKNHHRLKLKCNKCGDSVTCRCNRPHTEEIGICPECMVKPFKR